jgi:pyruvate/2-oxoglutarate dehydrogenase complex dihydrolipoamide dehydrogenase (E3) component
MQSTAAYDILAIGGGTAGLVTAAGGAGLGARVALVERHRMGGECLWNGCVPSKALIAAAKAAHHARHARRLGVEVGDVTVHLEEALDHVRRVQERIAPHDSPERFRGLGVDVHLGQARIVAPGVVEVNGNRLRARHIVIATGTRPAVPPIPGLADAPYLTNESVFDIAALPRTLLVIGGGPIGTELAQAFARLGSTVHVVEALPDFFAREDRELAALLQQQLVAEGIRFHLGAKATAVRHADGITSVDLQRADGTTHTLSGDALLVAVGRAPNIKDLGLDTVGVATDRGGVITDRYLQTNVPGIWAVGDIVSGSLKFTHAADHMARGLLRNALFPGKSPLDFSAVPWVTYTDPELAHVGLTETEARARFGSGVGVWRRDVGAVDRVIADAAPGGMVKIVTDAKGRVLGGHILGPHAGDMIGELTMALKYKMTVAQLGAVIHPYPTTAEAVKQAAEMRVKSTFSGWKKSLVRWLVRRG